MDAVGLAGRLDEFLVRLERMFAEYYEEGCPEIGCEVGRKYVKLVLIRPNGGRCAYGFVNRENGDLLKAASWAAPAKHARGNVFNEDYGIGACGPYGMAYLR